MGKLAFLFPGQASQYPGMGRELAANHPAARSVFDEADRALGFSISELRLQSRFAERESVSENRQSEIVNRKLDR